MKILFAAFLLVFTCIACQKKEELPAPQAPVAKEDSAPAGYLSSVAKAKQSMEKNIDTVALNNAIQLFGAQEGRNPTNLNELVDKKYLPKLPAAPFGTSIRYDAKEGKATVVTE